MVEYEFSCDHMTMTDATLSLDEQQGDVDDGDYPLDEAHLVDSGTMSQAGYHATVAVVLRHVRWQYSGTRSLFYRRLPMIWR